MNLLTLTDSKLAALHRQAANEIARRAKAATNGYDAATIIRGNEMAKRRFWSLPPETIRFSSWGHRTVARQCFGAGPGTWIEQYIRGPALFLRLPRQSASILRLFVSQDREIAGSVSGGGHHGGGCSTTAKRTKWPTGDRRGGIERPDCPHDEPHQPHARSGLRYLAQGGLLGVFHRPRCPQSHHRRRPDDCEPGPVGGDQPGSYLRSDQLPGVSAVVTLPEENNEEINDMARSSAGRFDHGIRVLSLRHWGCPRLAGRLAATTVAKAGRGLATLPPVQTAWRLVTLLENGK